MFKTFEFGSFDMRICFGPFYKIRRISYFVFFNIIPIKPLVDTRWQIRISVPYGFFQSRSPQNNAARAKPLRVAETSDVT
jgi:hypothetical protein